MAKPNRAKSSGQVALARKLFATLAVVLRQQGLEAPDVRAMCMAAADLADAPVRKTLRIPPSKDSALLGSALALWHRDSRFLDEAGFPKPLRAYGRTPSVESLLRAADVRHKTKASVQFLLRAGLVKRVSRNKCLPTNRSARIPSTDAYFIEHIAQGVMKLVQTAHFNFTPVGRRQPLLQRAASIRRLPRKYKSAYREYVNQQGNAFVTNIDDWLEARVIRDKKPGTRQLNAKPMSAGVYAFAFVD
jgi:hypothetical protein